MVSKKESSAEIFKVEKEEKQPNTKQREVTLEQSFEGRGGAGKPTSVDREVNENKGMANSEKHHIGHFWGFFGLFVCLFVCFCLKMMKVIQLK